MANMLQSAIIEGCQYDLEFNEIIFFPFGAVQEMKVFLYLENNLEDKFSLGPKWPEEQTLNQRK